MEMNVYYGIDNESLWVVNMIRDIDPGLLRAFIAVAEQGGMTSAGRILNLTQAAVSQQIKRLEEQFQLDLFDRKPRQLILTANGERLLAYARRMLSLNDEIWGMMTKPHVQGEVKLGVPYDIVGPFVPPILREFSRAWPRVDVSLVCDATQILLERLGKGEIDIALTTEPDCGKNGEILMIDRLVWVGVKDGDAYNTDPLPVSLGSETCTFRACATEALTAQSRNWRFTCLASDMGALLATLEADLAIAPLLSQTVPDGMEALGDESGLPALPDFYVNLYIRSGTKLDAVEELARYIRRNFAQRFSQAA